MSQPLRGRHRSRNGDLGVAPEGKGHKPQQQSHERDDRDERKRPAEIEARAPARKEIDDDTDDQHGGHGHDGHHIGVERAPLGA
jgi:hypothetical protein